MNYPKTYGVVVAVIALALVAAVGVPIVRASAKICSTAGSGESCGGAHGAQYTTQAFSASTGTSAFTWTSGFIRVECPSSISGNITHSGSGEIIALTFVAGGCKSTIGECTVFKATGLPWKGITAVTGSGGNGTLQIKTTIGLDLTCGGVNCQYTGPSAGTKGEITVTGSDTAPVIKAEKVPMSKSGGSAFCSGTSEWDGTYTVTTPASLWLT